MEIVITGEEAELERLSDGRFVLVRKLEDKTVFKFFSVLSAYVFMKIEAWGFYEKKGFT